MNDSDRVNSDGGRMLNVGRRCVSSTLLTGAKRLLCSDSAEVQFIVNNFTVKRDTSPVNQSSSIAPSNAF
ncbi:hypothetical protein Y032_0121g1010 [Ancylostoma ceylanicum]|uniref:Uncharacterized protein n=1 Tax=Ancylostoma ceylanicum TaxID=53326 RepID=A0A016TA99_9BILA|nr:hypothetical protein Y032_0121g1010 [Ancylostoma ceylanicum]